MDTTAKSEYEALLGLLPGVSGAEQMLPMIAAFMEGRTPQSARRVSLCQRYGAAGNPRIGQIDPCYLLVEIELETGESFSVERSLDGDAAITGCRALISRVNNAKALDDQDLMADAMKHVAFVLGPCDN